MKQYKLLVETAEYPKGTIIEHVSKGDETSNTYNVKLPDGTIFMSQFFTGQIENHPEVWELMEDKSKPHPYRPFVPKKGEEYWYTSNFGTPIDSIYRNKEYEHLYFPQGVFPTEKGARMEALRREARAKCWVPNKGDDYYAYNIDAEEAIDHQYLGDDDCDLSYVSMGNVHRTKQEALEWKEKYLEAFTCLL